ncbi:MAG: TadE/TadG family type IV pilus assembly protein [Janthinobacterium lividum]
MIPFPASRSAVSTLEFALLAPILLVLALAMSDVITWIRNDFKLEQVAAQMGQIISSCKALDDPGDFRRFASEAQLMAGSLDITSTTGVGAFIVSGVTPSGTTETIRWQYFFGNPIYHSILCDTSSACSTDAIATIPGNYMVPKNQVLIATESVASVGSWVLSAKILNLTSSSVQRAYSLFLVRTANPIKLATVSKNPSNSTVEGCGS